MSTTLDPYPIYCHPLPISISLTFSSTFSLKTNLSFIQTHRAILIIQSEKMFKYLLLFSHIALHYLSKRPEDGKITNFQRKRFANILVRVSDIRLYVSSKRHDRRKQWSCWTLNLHQTTNSNPQLFWWSTYLVL
jgi:hypothetical protein